MTGWFVGAKSKTEINTAASGFILGYKTLIARLFIVEGADCLGVSYIKTTDAV